MTDRSSLYPTSRWKLLALCYLVVFVSIMGLAYTNRIPTYLVNFPHADKVAHGVLYAIAAYLGHQVLKRRRFWLFNVGIPLFPAFFGLFTLGEELLQSLSPYRTLDLGDLVCSLAGVLLGYWCAERSHLKK